MAYSRYKHNISFGSCRSEHARTGTHHAHRERDRKVERVERGLVNNDEVVSVPTKEKQSAIDEQPNALPTTCRAHARPPNSLSQGKFGKVDVIFWGGDEVDQLAKFGLKGHVVEELEEEPVVGIGAEMLLEQKVDGGLEHERVVDRDVAYAFLRTQKAAGRMRR